jgi:hypothetical protein
MKTKLVFKLERSPEGFGQIFSPNCNIEIINNKGFVYLNYEKRNSRIMGHFDNLRKEGEVIVADITLFERHIPIEHRLEYAIEGFIVSKNDKEVTSLKISGIGALMDSKF